jgi:hypothetical protein
MGLGVYNGNPSTNDSPKGFWNILKRVTRVVVSMVSNKVFGTRISDAIDKFLADHGMRTAGEDLTDRETTIVNLWVNQYFKQFFGKLADMVDFESSTSLRGVDNSFITTVNEIRELMAVAISYNDLRFINKFTQDEAVLKRVIQAKLEIMETHFSTLNTFIDEMLLEKGITYTTSLSTIKASNYNALLTDWNLDWQGKSVSVSFDKLIDKSDSNPVDISDHPPVEDNNTTTTTTTGSVLPIKESKYLKIAVVAGIAYVVGKAISKKSK